MTCLESQLVSGRAGPGTPCPGLSSSSPKGLLRPGGVRGVRGQSLSPGPLEAAGLHLLASAGDPASPADSRSLHPGRSYDEKVDVFSFGIVLCEVGRGAGGSWHEAWWLLSTPGLQAASLQGPQVGGELLGTGLPTATSTPGGRGGQAGARPSVTCSQPQGTLPRPLPPWVTAGPCAGQIIGRVNADPDYLPRTMDFGLNVRGFLDRYCPPNCPPSFFPITVHCCDLDPEKR